MHAVVESFLNSWHCLRDLGRSALCLHVLVLAALTSGCSDPGDAPVQAIQSIRNGDPTDETWAVQLQGDDASCSGVLITPAHA
jgi:hypothetical protein